MKNFIQKGDILGVVAPAAVTSGEFIMVVNIGGVCETDAAQNDTVQINRKGVHTLPKANEAVAQGDPAYWDGVNKCFTKTSAAGLHLAGSFAEAALQASTTASVLLDGTIRLAVAGA